VIAPARQSGDSINQGEIPALPRGLAGQNDQAVRVGRDLRPTAL